jgi:predicted Zn-dependent protease
MLKSLFDSMIYRAPESNRFLSREACRSLADRIFAMTTGGGETTVNINSYWRGNLRWGRNQVSTGGDTQETSITIIRAIKGARGVATTNAMDDDALRDCIQRAEALIIFSGENPEEYPDSPPETLPHSEPKIWFDSTYNVDAEVRGATAETLIAPAEAADLFSAGYLSVSASGYAVISTTGLFRYYPFTTAQYSVTVRDKKGTGSGWAGVDFNDWERIDAAKLSAIALDKCQRSQNPVRVEPGRYTAILEPQAVCDLFAPILDRAMDRVMAEMGMGPFAAGNGNSKIGQQLLDDRITVSADPMDPDCGFVPFDWNGEPYQKVNWFENGILKELAYGRRYGLTQLGKDAALPNSRAFRISGGKTTVEEMIASTERGILVTRFNAISIIDFNSMLLGGNTRDGLWLVERGKITKAIKNFRITESPLFVFNNIVQLGIPQRVFRPGAPAVVPALKVNDFSFTGMMDAV